MKVPITAVSKHLVIRISITLIVQFPALSGDMKTDEEQLEKVDASHP